jgi:hypothetical protein
MSLRLSRWRVSLITKTPAKFVDFTLAPDAATAERQVAEAHDISRRCGIGLSRSGRIGEGGRIYSSTTST